MHGHRISSFLLILQWLDHLLQGATELAHNLSGLDSAANPYQGLHTSIEEMEQLLTRQPGEPTLRLETNSDSELLLSLIDKDSPLSRLHHNYGLTVFDLEVIVIALAPEIDRRYERLYAFLQENVTYTLPTVDLALHLLCESGTAKLIQRNRFDPSAPLIQQGLLHLLADPDRVHSTLLGHYLVLDEQIVRLLLGQKGLDSRLTSFCQLVEPQQSISELALPSNVRHALSQLTTQLWPEDRPFCFYFEGPDQQSKAQAAEALAKQVLSHLLIVDLARWMEPRDIATTLRLLMREAQFQQALLFIDHTDAWNTKDKQPLLRQLTEALSSYPSISILAGLSAPAEMIGSMLDSISVSFNIPEYDLRRACWHFYLTEHGISLDDTNLDSLADCFRLFPDQIRAAVSVARNRARWVLASHSDCPDPMQRMSHHVELADLYAAASAQSGYELSSMAKRIERHRHLDDVVLPPDQHRQLREICNHVRYRHVVHGEWGFERKLSLGKGLNVLFYGPPGTGKTMAAEALANELRLDVYKIDLSQIVSKYIGETEKNLNRIFNAAESANCILLFDEADAILGKRSEVKDAHDRYANLEIAYLLQKMEEYEGISILTTNLRQNLDQAFTRRIRFMVEFPFPKPDYRFQLWHSMWSPETPLSSDIDFHQIAQRYELAGGSIRNSALAAAFLAVSDQQEIQERHILQAIKTELQKMGRLINDLDF